MFHRFRPTHLAGSTILPLCCLSLLTSPLHAAGSLFYTQSPSEILAKVPNGMEQPTDAQLKTLAAVLLTDGTPWDDATRTKLEAYVKRGGGLVLVHDAITASGLFKGEVKRWEGGVPLFISPIGRTRGITTGISNFDVADEMMYGFELPENAEVLATTWTPNRKHLKGTEPQPYVYGVSPTVWTMPFGDGRIVCIVPGKNGQTLKHPAILAMIDRALAWAGKQPAKAGDKTLAHELTYPPGGPLDPKAALGSIQTHPEFTAGLIAAEPLISKPLNIDWDGEGRLWVVESLEYPEGRKGGGPESMYSVWQRETNLPKPAAVSRPGRDRIARLEDSDGDGIMDSKHVFAEDLDLATSFCFYRDGVIVAQPPEILRLRDTDGDGKADKREVLYAGLGTFDTHSVLNNLRWGLDGWIYSTHGYSSSPKVTSGDGKTDFGAIGSGIVRFRPDGSMIEMVSAKSGNCWGVEMTADGELFFTQPTSGDLVMHVPVSDRIMAEGGMGREPSWNVMVRLRPVKPLMSWEEIVENQPNDVIGSFTAACGCAVYEGGSWPERWTLGYFTAEPTVHIVHHEQLTNKGVTYEADKTREEEFSATQDFWSRPIDTRIGPDGQLYVIDFYNQAILHNDPRGPIHLWNNQAARPDRDHFFGRIHRYSHKESKPLPAADMKTLAGQISALNHPNREVRFRAQRLIEEGDVKNAANKLIGAKGTAAMHGLWIRSAAGVLTADELAKTLAGSDASLKATAARVLAAHPSLATSALKEEVSVYLTKETDSRLRLQWLAALPADTVLPAALLVSLQARSDDRWTHAAIARLARNNPGEVLAAALDAPEPAKQASLAALLFDAGATDEAKLASMLGALSGPENLEIALSALAKLRQREIAKGPKVTEALEKLASDQRPALAAAALPLAASRWDDAQRAKRLPDLIGKLTSSAPQDAGIMSSLATLPLFTDELSIVLQGALVRPDDFRNPVIDALVANPSADAAKLMIGALPSVSPADKARILEALLGRPASAIALTDALETGSLPLAIAGPQIVARLADHPDEKVRTHATPTVTRLRGATEAKSALITRLLPEISAPGDAAAGKALFASCAVCHVYKGEGTNIGPVLEGMGVHGVESLLTHIIDPNREVEPSFHVWNVTTTDGGSVSGFVSRETADSIFVRHAGGEVEVPRNKITSKVDTGRSLMPEGFEALGGPGLRDLVAYLRSGEQRFHSLSFGKAATADGTRGVYMATDVAGDRVGIRKYGLVEERGVPFHLVDPAISGKNVIVLKGGARGEALSNTMPMRVEIPVNQAAGRLHLLGAVAGWGFPAVAERIPLVKLEVVYTDGTAETIVLTNGVDIADHVAGVDVPGSARTSLTDHGQVRYLWRNLEKPSVPIEKIIISSTASAPAPMIAAITLESAAKDGSLPAAPADGGPALSN